jgi:hypothetical protein
LELTDEQKAEIRDRLFDAQVAVLRAIVREADKVDGPQGTRAIRRLTHAYQALQGGGWFMYEPNVRYDHEPDGVPRRAYTFDESEELDPDD